MSVAIEPYEPYKVELIKRHLQSQLDRGFPRYFEVCVDQLKVVPRTNRVEDFDQYLDYITESTKKLRILLYSTSATSPRNEQHVFLMGKQKEEGLSGIDIEKRIEEKVRQERERWDCEQTKKELETAKVKLGEAEDYIDQLQERLLELKEKKSELAPYITAVVSGLSKHPALGNLLPKEGLGEVDEQEETTEEEASFKAKEEVTSDHVRLLEKLEERFGQQELDTIMAILGFFSEHQEAIDQVAEFLNLE